MKIVSRINLTVVVFLVLAFLIFVFGAYPFFKNIEKNSEELVRQKKELAILEAQAANLEEFKAAHQDIEEAAERINNLFVDARVPVDFIRFLETTSERHYLDVSISPPTSGKFGKDYWQSLVFQLNSRGSFLNLLRFLEEMENAPYLIEIQNLNISREGGGVRAAFSLKVFAQ